VTLARNSIELGDFRLAVVDEGEGAPVLLLHGFPDSADLWREQIPALVTAGFRAIAPDLRGFGHSDKPSKVEDYAMPLILQDVVGLMDRLEVERAHVVGHDWGAVVAWLLATLQPERVGSLVAVSVGHPSGFRPMKLPQLQKSWYVFLFQFSGTAEEALQRDDWQMFREWLRDAADADHYLDQMGRPGALTAGLNWYRANVPPESFLTDPPPFPSVKGPALGIWGARDDYLTEEQMTSSGERVAGTWRYERFDDAGHWVPLDQAERFNRLLIEFLLAKPDG
jgi:pimeloyl-ACP methyl ester carboxylesterase